jgi:probable rRNA maturation factor
MKRAARKTLTRRPGRRRRPAPTIDIVVASELWKTQRDAKTILRRSIAEAAMAVSTTEGELAVVLTNDKAIRALNRDWRRKDAATNVLSFPAKNPAKKPSKSRSKKPSKTLGSKPRAARETPCLLGDIVIAFETTEREARAEQKPFAHHLAHLAVHGFLHLVGYDHVADDEANVMEGLETAILARLDVPNPYIARDARAVSVSETALDSSRLTRFLRRTASPLRRKML